MYDNQPAPYEVWLDVYDEQPVPANMENNWDGVCRGVKEKIRKLAGYLEKNRKRIQYETDREDGYPIGSCGIESFHKFVYHTQMKRSGAWWVKGIWEQHVLGPQWLTEPTSGFSTTMQRSHASLV